MSDGQPKRKSGRTAEQQAARDARKAAKKAAAEAAAADNGAANAETNDENTEEGGEKRKRPVYEDAEMLEVDLKAGVPLSKAEMRAAKKRVKLGQAPVEKKADYMKKAKKLAEDEEEEGEGEEGARRKEKAAPKEEKSQFSVWIGNMSFRTQPDALKTWMQTGITESGGEDDCITRVYLPKKAARGEFSENKGFAYIDFKTEEQMLLAMGLSERPLDGRRLLIKAGNDHKANPNARTPKTIPSGPGTAAIGKQKHAESSTLFIGNLPFDVTEEELRELIEDNCADLIAEQEEAEPEQEEAEPEQEEAEGEGDEEMDEEAREAAREKRAKETLTKGKRGSAKAGLIKTRVAQFEDTGRCKGFAFWDFKSPVHARAALMNKKNHFLRGSKLTLQYASQEATKRAGGKRKRDNDSRPAKFQRRERPQRYFEGNGDAESAPASAHAPARTDFKSEAAAQARIAAMVSGGGEEERTDKRDKRGKKWESTGRPRPGAALMMAQREKPTSIPRSSHTSYHPGPRDRPAPSAGMALSRDGRESASVNAASTSVDAPAPNPNGIAMCGPPIAIFQLIHVPPSLHSMVAGAGAGLVSSIATCPLDVVKTTLQAQSVPRGAEGYEGVSKTIVRIYRQNGLRGFYRGLGPTIGGYLPTWGIYFTVYDFIKDRLRRVPLAVAHPDTSHVAAAMAAGATGTILTNPLWVVKTRFMAQATLPPTAPRYRNTVQAFYSIYKTEGLRAFYKGLVPSLFGVTHVAVQFGLYEKSKTWASRDGRQLTPTAILGCSSVSKMIASLATYPHEVLRTRIQVQRNRPAGPPQPPRPPEGAVVSAGPGPIGAPVGSSTRVPQATLYSPLVTGSEPPYPQKPEQPMSGNGRLRRWQPKHGGIIDVCRLIYRQDGWRGFYRGLSINLVRTVPSSAVTMLSYELIMRNLALSSS
ncbi:hypothetical protein CspHIS471_0411500 [Cutaneotrichosporon sp. HIS471]|nr:hypothetical protein CspHIS471_0411500 [Cutaneotrichosporon sp. HIS471]